MLSVEAISTTLGAFHLRDVSLHVPEGEYCCIIGPTGVGKTVLLECLTGLHPVTSGAVRIGGEDVTRLPPERRPLGYVPQDYALFPHLSVFDNIAYGLVEHRVPRHEAAERVESVAGLLAIEHLLQRRPKTLSGGEAQRTALARALVLRRNLLLMDEPFGALDQLTKRQLFRYLRAIHRDLGLTVVHITHDFAEAFGLAGMVAVVLDAGIRQVGTPREVFTRPATREVAAFLGIRNLWRLSELESDAGDFLARVRDGARDGRAADDSLCLTPDSIGVQPLGAQADSRLVGEAVLRESHWQGTAWDLELDCGLPVHARLGVREFEALGADAGDRVLVSLAPSRVHWIAG